MITENTYGALKDKGAQVSDDVKYTYNNENTDFPVAVDDIHQVYIERIGEAVMTTKDIPGQEIKLCRVRRKHW